jgi:hypothetical protein
MKHMQSSRLVQLVALAALAFAGSAHAGPIPYPNGGTENTTLYSFSAATTGDLMAYFVDGGGATFTNELTVSINGVASAVQGLNNHASSYGTAIDFGHVAAGDSIVFKMVTLDQSNVGPWYSDKSLNADGANHVYATDFAGDATIPAGTYVGFEDIPVPGADFNYNDEAFVFTNVSVGTVPEPETWALTMLGLGALFGLKKARARSV